MSQGPVPIGPLAARGRAREPGPHVVIVGAGLLGAAAAEALTRRDAQVTIVDRGRAGAAASAQSMGWVNASARVKTEHTQYRELSMVAVAAHDRLARDLAPAGWLHRSGHLEWVAKEDAEELAARVERLAEYGYPAGVITSAETRALEPALRVGADAAVAWYPGEVWVDPARLVRRLLDAAADNGATLLEDTAVVTLTRDSDGRVTGVELAEGDRITADVVVNAAGRDATPLASAAGSSLTLRPAPALVAYVKTGTTGEGVLPVTRPVSTPFANLRPDGTTHLWVNSETTDTALLDRAPAPVPVPDDSGTGDAGDAAGPADLTSRLLDALAASVELPAHLDLTAAGTVTTVTAERPMPADGLPSVGGLRSAPGYYEAVTHSGATLAPLLGDLLAQEITGGQESPILAPFRPGRFAQGEGQEQQG
jgi:glycine/D-amino acid oxidase-like deaminating enzyme